MKNGKLKIHKGTGHPFSILKFSFFIFHLAFDSSHGAEGSGAANGVALTLDQQLAHRHRELVFSALAAVLAVSVAPSQLTSAEPPAFASLSPLRPVLILLVSVPIAALFLRMASLIAARNLFAAHFSVFALGCTSLAVALLSTVQFRLLLLLRRPGESLPLAISSIAELHIIVLYALGFFLSVSFLSTRPYFRLQGRFLASLVLVPVPLYLAMLVEQYLVAPAAARNLGGGARTTTTQIPRYAQDAMVSARDFFTNSRDDTSICSSSKIVAQATAMSSSMSVRES